MARLVQVLPKSHERSEHSSGAPASSVSGPHELFARGHSDSEGLGIHCHRTDLVRYDWARQWRLHK